MATFGETGTGNSDDPTNNAWKEGCRFQCPANGTLTSISIYCVTAGINFKVALYSDNAGNPDVLLAESAGTGSSGAGNTWATVNIDAPLTAGAFYHLFEKGDGGAFTIRLNTASTGYSYGSENYGDAWTNPFGAATFDDPTASLCINATYTPAAAANPLVTHIRIR